MLSIEQKTIGEIAILDIEGEISISGAPLFRSRIDEHCKNGRFKIILNMSKVTDVSPCGIGELISAFTQLTNKGGNLVLVNITNRLRDLLIITKLLSLFTCCDDEQTAIDSFSK